jgi:hypothetical protein
VWCQGVVLELEHDIRVGGVGAVVFASVAPRARRCQTFCAGLRAVSGTVWIITSLHIMFLEFYFPSVLVLT